MASIDIRELSEETVNTIIFSDDDLGKLERANSRSVNICDTCDYVQLSSKEHAQNLIKALEKAIELGWLE